MSAYKILVPNIELVKLTPNPVFQNSTLKVSLVVSEIEKILIPEIRYSGEFYSGEV